MLYYSRYLLLLFILCCFCKANATHIFGGDINYKHINGNTYEISLVLYADCSGQSFPNLFNSIPVVEIQNNGNTTKTITLNSFGIPGLEVTPVCPSQQNNTTCQGGSVPGVAEFKFKNTVTLPSKSANWSFLFTGSMGANNQTGRSNSLTNVVVGGGGGSIMMLEATLNNLTVDNNSATYTTIPTPFFCMNAPQQYNQGAVDSDGDILTFSMVPGLDVSSGVVSYINPFTFLNPLVSNGFAFSSNSGQMSFTPTAVQKSLVVTKVTEIRNGIIVGTTMREMTFIVENSCNNQSPLGVITSTNIGKIKSPTEIELCESDDSLLVFTIQANDPDTNGINITTSGLPPNTTTTIFNNNTKTPSIQISMLIPKPFVAQVYNFYVTFQDDGCPLSSKQTIAYSVNYKNPFTINSILSPESCYPTHDGQIIINAQSSNGQVQYSTNGTTYFTNDTLNNLVAGNYTFFIKDVDGCKTNTEIILTGATNPILNLLATDISCFGYNNGLIKSSITPANASYTYTLFPFIYTNTLGSFSNLSKGSYTIVVRDNKQCADTASISIAEPPPIYFTSLQKDDLTCEKQNGRIWVTSNFTDAYYILKPIGINSTNGIFEDLPAGTYKITAVNSNSCSIDTFVTLNTIPKTLSAYTTQHNLECWGNGTEGYAEVFVNGGTPPYTYLWTTNPIQTTTKASNLYYGLYQVKVIDATGCDVEKQLYLDAGNCCENIIIPNAFTPNGDGVNDNWGLITSTGMQIQQFMVVNRWGQKIWSAEDQRTKWDGRFKTRIIENGTYFYYLKYKCLSDEKYYIKKGDISVFQ